MVGGPDVVQPWMPRDARDSDACLWHVSIVGGARRRGCAAGGLSLFFNGPPVLDDDATWMRRVKADGAARDQPDGGGEQIVLERAQRVAHCRGIRGAGQLDRALEDDRA